MAKNCKKILRVQKLSPVFVPYGDHYDPTVGGNVQIYMYDFVKKGCFRLLTLFCKYHPLDKHFKHGFKIFDEFLIIYSILWIDMDNIILLYKC